MNGPLLMARRFAPITLLLLVVPATAPSDTTEDLVARLERIAAELPWLTTGDVIYNRDPRFGPDAEKVAALLRDVRAPLSVSQPAAYPRVRAGASTIPATTIPTSRLLQLDRIGVGRPDPEDIRPLLRHSNPKVRTLAIVVLLELERLDVMADIAMLVEDEAETFPSPAQLALGPISPQPWPMERRSVADYARAAVAQYVGASAYWDELRRDSRLPREGKALAQAFRVFSTTRDPYTNTATLRVALKRATGGTTPVPGERLERVQQFLMQIHSLPMPRRFFVAHALDLPRLAGERYSPDLLLDLARQVPRDVRLRVLDNKLPAIDPDLGSSAGWDYFTTNAVHLLRVEDVELLLRLDADQVAQSGASAAQGFATAAYVVAASRLDPGRAEAILIPALALRTSDRNARVVAVDNAAAISAVLAELGGAEGVRRAVDWFFEQRPQPGAFGFGREAILSQLQAAHPYRYRQFVERIVRDERLGTLGPASTRMLLRAAQGYSGLPLVDEEQIRDSYGVDESQRDRRPAYLPEWHRALRQSIDEWDRVR